MVVIFIPKSEDDPWTNHSLTGRPTSSLSFEDNGDNKRSIDKKLTFNGEFIKSNLYMKQSNSQSTLYNL